MTARRNFIKGLAAAGTGVALAGTDGALAAARKEPITIGSALPLSGFAAADGGVFRTGLELGIEAVNRYGGVLGRPLRLVVEDTREMGPDNVSQAMRRLIDRHQPAVIINNYNVGTNMIEMDVAADNDTLFLHYNCQILHNIKYMEDPQRFANVFQLVAPEVWYGRGFLAYLKTLRESGEWQPASDKIAIVSSANEYAGAIANAIQDQAGDYGFSISLLETVPVPTTQWGPTLAKIRAEPPAAIAVTHFLAQDLAQFALQFAQQPTPSLLYMQYGPALPLFREIAGDAADGVLYSILLGTLSDDYAAAFRAAYHKKSGADSGSLAAGAAYDAVGLWAQCAAVAGAPSAAGDKARNDRVAAALRRSVYRGVIGALRIDPETQSAFTYPAQIADPTLGTPHQMLQHQPGNPEARLVAPALYANGRFRLPSWVV